MEKLDKIVLDKVVQVIANIFDYYGGLKYYNLAMAVSILGSAYFTAAQIRQSLEAGSVSIVGSTIIALVVMFYVFIIYKLAKLGRANTSQGKINPNRDDSYETVTRPFLMVFILILTAVDLFVDGSLPVVSVLLLTHLIARYLVACQEAPPPMSKTAHSY
jgi:Ca2+/Na+ antiporter